MLGASRIRFWLEQLLHTHDTPRRTAAAFALGIFLGFSPFLGLHALMGLALAFLLRLNRVAVLVGVYANLPWILVPYYTLATIAGAALLGVDVHPQALKEAMNVVAASSWRNLAESTRVLAPLLWAYTIGSTLGALLLAAISYQASLSMLLAHRRRRDARGPQR
jgi:uncharacterized protein (DUF2062 family)